MLCEKMADKLDMVAYDKSFADRVAELALADSLTKSAKPGWIRRGLAHVGVASITSEEEAQALRKKKNRSSSESAALNAWDTFSKRDDAKDFGFPDKKAASTYRPMFNIAKKVHGPHPAARYPDIVEQLEDMAAQVAHLELEIFGIARDRRGCYAVREDG